MNLRRLLALRALALNSWADVSNAIAWSLSALLNSNPKLRLVLWSAAPIWLRIGWVLKLGSSSINAVNARREASMCRAFRQAKRERNLSSRLRCHSPRVLVSVQCSWPQVEVLKPCPCPMSCPKDISRLFHSQTWRSFIHRFETTRLITKVCIVKGRINLTFLPLMGTGFSLRSRVSLRNNDH